MTDLAGALHQALRDAGVPVEAVSIGDAADRRTWSVRYNPSPSPAQLQTAAQLVATFDATAAQTVLDAQEATNQGALAVVRATVAYVLRVKNNGVNPTPSELNQAMDVWKAIYKAVR
jgi:hypothetical protein